MAASNGASPSPLSQSIAWRETGLIGSLLQRPWGGTAW